MFNIYPYNLYALIVMLIVFLVYLSKTLIKLKQVNGQLSDAYRHSSTIRNDFSHVNQLLHEKHTKTKQFLQKLAGGFGLFMLWRAIHKEYRKTDSHGMKGLSHSTYRVMQKREANRTIRKVISRIFE